MTQLTQDEIHALHKAAIDAGLASERSTLMAGIAPAFVASLRGANTPSSQLLNDLNSFNDIALLKDGSRPLEIWLQNAIRLSSERPECGIFEEMLERRRGISTSLPRKASTPPEKEEFLIDFAILTAIEVERKAVCMALGLEDSHRKPKGSRDYWRGRLPLRNDEFYEIVVAQCSDMANVDAALVTSDMLREWKPSAALLVGIAAAAHEDVRLGDVVPGSDVYYHERGKETASGVKPELKMIPADPVLFGKVNTLSTWDGTVSIPRPDGSAMKPTVLPGVIASGERVIANAMTRDAIASGHRKIRAIEMEGYGFCRAVLLNEDKIRHLVVRGICDDASQHKGDAWHAYAAAAAAAFTRHFLLDRPLEPRNKPRP